MTRWCCDVLTWNNTRVRAHTHTHHMQSIKYLITDETVRTVNTKHHSIPFCFLTHTHHMQSINYLITDETVRTLNTKHHSMPFCFLTFQSELLPFEAAKCNTDLTFSFTTCFSMVTLTDRLWKVNWKGILISNWPFWHLYYVRESSI